MKEPSASPSHRRNAGLRTMGILVAPPSGSDLGAVRSGDRNTVTVRIRCGECDGEWEAELEPKGHRESTCPHCGASNRFFREWTSA